MGPPNERLALLFRDWFRDSARVDVGGAALGIRTLILPRTRGPVHGLEAAARLVRNFVETIPV